MPDLSQQTSTAGQYTSAHAAGAGGAAIALTGPGRLCRITVQTLGTAATVIYDNTSAAGTALFTVPASPAVGTIYDVQMPAAIGIFVGGATNTSGITLSYTKDTPYGR